MRAQFEAERFLYREAKLLDERRFEEWLDLLTDDVRYWMPVGNLEGAGAPDGQHLSYFEDNKQTLMLRIKRLGTGFAHAEDPPSRTRHLISNIVVEAFTEAELKVSANFIVFRGRLETEEDLFVGRREDVLRKVDGQWKLAARKILLDHNVIGAKNLSLFF
ncbi:MAG: 3-phenylpropionate/cinnamic acid dioxygenase subunit beta [Acidobacteria bacterium]|nr:MAG: 3-phenylpropionate/cinnamic acid dioxygenase subunit beta [Acidobacteriota bacterium]